MRYNVTCRVIINEVKCCRRIKNVSDSLCDAHYNQKRRGAEFTDPRFRKTNGESDRICVVYSDGIKCRKKATYKKLCVGHYNQKRRGSDFSSLRINKTRDQVCARDAAGRKLCTICETWQEESCFNTYSATPDRLGACCKKCRRNKRIMVKYGITAFEWDNMFMLQGSACAVCKTQIPGKKGWVTDHNHACCPGDNTCGMCVRGILCSSCNITLGHVKDSVEILKYMIRYLSTVTLPA